MLRNGWNIQTIHGLATNGVEAVVDVFAVALMLERPRVFIAMFELDVSFVTRDLPPLAGPTIVNIVQAVESEVPFAMMFNATESRDECGATVDTLKFDEQPFLEEHSAGQRDRATEYIFA